MPAQVIRNRSALISQRFVAERDEIVGGLEVFSTLEQVDQLEALASGTIYLLRDNKAALLRLPTAEDESGYADAKAEIDQLIEKLITWKFQLRAARRSLSSQVASQTQDADEGFIRLAEMYRDGTLTTDEFARLHGRR